MRPDADGSTAATRVLVTAHGWTCVQRVIVLLTGRAYVVGSFTATPSARAPYWQVSIELRCDPDALRLLQARLERLPAVTAVLTSPPT